MKPPPPSPEETGGLAAGTVEVITEVRRQEAGLKPGAWQNAILDSANFSSIATDEKGDIQICHVGAGRMLGYAAADAVNNPGASPGAFDLTTHHACTTLSDSGRCERERVVPRPLAHARGYTNQAEASFEVSDPSRMNQITPADLSDPQEVIARAAALSRGLGTPIAPGFEALVFKASRGIEDICELTCIRKDGSRFPAGGSVTALRDGRNGIIELQPSHGVDHGRCASWL